MTVLNTLWSWLLKALLVLGAAALTVMMLVVVANSAGRALFNQPIWFTLDGAGLLGLAVVVVAMVYAEHERVNVIITVIFNRFPPRIRLGLQSFTLLLCSGAAAWLCWGIGHSTVKAFRIAERTQATSIPLAPFRLVFGFCMLILCLYLLTHLAEDLRKLVRR